jgi:glycosyltransferase involved in cell wall biosynthesis
MCKNETKRFHVTLNSIIGYAHSLVVYDTGSTDDTIEIAEKFSRLNNIPLHLKRGEFIDFSTSRNVSLDFIDTFLEIDYILLLDVNDELRNGDKLIEYCTEHLNSPSTGFLICQQWQTGSLDKYYNMRLVKARSGWRYFGKVHEWMKNTSFEEGKGPIVLRAPDNIILYQDRTKDDNKSSKRFLRDKILLTEEHRQNQYESRTLFYLAQTCSCLNQHEESIYYYKLRLNVEGFQEERFHSFLRIGDISLSLN